MKGILFDMDGVLMDTMKYHTESFKEALSRVGVEVKEEEVYELEGEGAGRLIEEVLKRRNRGLSDGKFEEVLEEKRKVFEEIEDSEPFPGMFEVLDELKVEYKLGLVSGSGRENVMGYVEEFFPDIFDCVVTEDDVERQKPNPDPYLKCAEKLDLDPENVLVIENAPLGIESAKNADMRCVAVASYVSPDKLEKADGVFENHNMLKKFIQEELLNG